MSKSVGQNKQVRTLHISVNIHKNVKQLTPLVSVEFTSLACRLFLPISKQAPVAHESTINMLATPVQKNVN